MTIKVPSFGQFLLTTKRTSPDGSCTRTCTAGAVVQVDVQVFLDAHLAEGMPARDSNRSFHRFQANVTLGPQGEDVQGLDSHGNAVRIFKTHCHHFFE